MVSLYDSFNEGISHQQVAASTDIIFVPTEKMNEFNDAGLLKNLDPLIKKNSLDLTTFHTEIIEYTRSLGDGSLYGIPTSIRGKVIAYNKEVFDKYQIDYPHDGMTWGEVLNVAQRFPKNGLILSGILPTEIIYDIGRIRGLQAYSSDSEVVSIANEQWEEVWQEVIIPLSNNSISTDRHSFFSNEAAMAILNDSDFHLIENNDAFDAVTMPIDPSDPTETTFTYIDGYYALSGNTAYINESFELLQFFLSPKISHLEKVNRHHTVSIHKNEPLLKTERALLNLKPISVHNEVVPFEFFSVGEATIEQLLTSSLSIKDALAIMQLEIEQRLLQSNNRGYNEI